MSIIIRLQNLPWEANSLDIRRYFQGLNIPDGGVHIVGGQLGDAFIAFSSDEDARQAMERDGGIVKDARIKLHLSSRNEMQRVIEQARNQSLGLKAAAAAEATNSVPQIPSLLPSSTQQNTNTNIGTNEHDSRPTRSPERTRQDRISNDRERLKPRSRSRSPIFVNEPNHRRAALNGPSIEEMRVNQLPSTLMGSSNQAVNPQPTVAGFSAGNSVRRPGGGFPDLPGIATPGLQPQDIRIPTNQWTQRPDVNFEGAHSNSLALANDRLLGGPASTEADRLIPNLPGQFLPNQPVSHGPVHSPPRVFSVEMRGLPFNVIPRDIQDFVRPVGLFIPDENIKILVDDRGYTTGGAIIKLSTEREIELALSLNSRFMDHRRIDVMPLLGNIGPADSLRNPPNNLPGNEIPGALHSDQIPERDYVTYMKGIPYNSCTEHDVATFFQGLRIVDLVFEVDTYGKPAGNAFVEFANREDYNAALDLNMRHMGRRYIEVFPTTREDMNDARKKSGNDLPRNQQLPNEPILRETFCISIQGLPSTVTNRDLTSYFMEINAPPFAIHIMLKPNGYNAGEAFVEFLNAEHQMRALRRNGETLGNHRINIKVVSCEFMRSIVGLPQSFPPEDTNMPRPLLEMGDRSREKSMRGNREDYRRLKEEGRKSNGSRSGDPFADSCNVVVASNIPYRATNDDICVFFADFDIGLDCVMRKYNEKGQATADAKIAFRSAEDANRAVRLMHKKFLIGRQIFLRHVV